MDDNHGKIWKMAIRFLSHRLFATLEEFEAALLSGELKLARPTE